MLSVKSFSAGKASAIANYIQGGAAENYYGQGHWGGQGAKILGLEGELKEGELEKMLNGRHPKTGEPITDKVDQDHKPGWDLTFSMPKSMSLIYAACPELREGIMRDHIAAVEKAMRYAESNAFFTRHSHAGKDKEPVMDSGGIIYSAHIHLGSRSGDPDIHSHVATANMTAEGRAIDLDTREKMTIGAVYRAELAYLQKERGIGIEKDETSFKAAGVSKDLCEEYSKSRNAIEEELERHGLSSAKSAAKIAVVIRQDKGNETDSDLIERVAPDLVAKGLTIETLKAAAAELAKEPPAMPTTQQIIDELLINESTVSMYQLKAAVVQAAQGHMSSDEALKHFEKEVQQSKSLVFLQSEKGVRVTNEATLARETQMLKLAQVLAARNTHPVRPETLMNTSKWDTLKPAQKEVVAYVTGGGDLVIVQGHAGTGKTYAVDAACQAWKAAGYNIIASTPSNQALNALSRELTAADTILNTTKLEIMLNLGQLTLDKNTILVIDEGGQEGSRRTAYIIEQALAAGSKVLYQGDTKQIQSVEAGAPMRGIMEVIGFAELGKESVQRQISEIQREIANDIREGLAGAAIGKMQELGQIQSYKDNLDAIKGAAASHLKNLEQGHQSILIATTRNEVKYLNGFVRRELQEKGQISREEKTFKTANGNREFAAGDKIMFGTKHEFEKGNAQTTVFNNSRGEVLEVADKHLIVKLDDTKAVVKVDMETYQKIDHGHAATSFKAQGEGSTKVEVLRGENSSLQNDYTMYTRHKETINYHLPEKLIERETNDKGQEQKSILERTMERSSAKDLSTDYQRIDPPGPAQPPSPSKEAAVSERSPNGVRIASPEQNQAKVEHGAEQVKSERSPKEVQMASPEQNQPKTQGKEHDSAKPGLEQAAERSQAMPESRANTSESNTKPRPEQAAERAQAKAKEQVKSTEKDINKPSLEQRQANLQKMNEQIKAKAAEMVKQVNALKEKALQLEKDKQNNKGLGL